jgi:hypothetical protein
VAITMEMNIRIEFRDGAVAIANISLSRYGTVAYLESTCSDSYVRRHLVHLYVRRMHLQHLSKNLEK